MAGFCRNCGTALGDAQAFCAKCGTKVGQASAASAPAQAVPPAGPSATPAAPPTPMAPAAAPAPPVAASGGGGALVKILLLVVVVIFLLGAIGVGSVMYIGYRFRQKAREMGLSLPSEQERRHHVSTLRGVDTCGWLSREDVSQAIGMQVVRAEAEKGENGGCAYSVVGDPNELTMKHATQLNKKQMSKADQQSMENFSKTILQGKSALSGGAAAEHPGETPVLAFRVDENGAQLQMKLTKGMLNGLGPMATANVQDLGDEAFDAAGAILFVRKGDKLLQMTYTQCPCGLDEILPLARTVATKM